MYKLKILKRINLLGKPIIKSKFNLFNNKKKHSELVITIKNENINRILFKNNIITKNLFKKKRNYLFCKIVNKEKNYTYKPPICLFIFTNKLNLELAINLNQLIISSYIGKVFKLEIAGYSRRALFNNFEKILYLRLGNSFVNIKKIPKFILFKIIKIRLLFLYALNYQTLVKFLNNMLTLKTTSSYKRTGLIFYNSLLNLKKKRSKVF